MQPAYASMHQDDKRWSLTQVRGDRVTHPSHLTGETKSPCAVGFGATHPLWCANAMLQQNLNWSQKSNGGGSSSISASHTQLETRLRDDINCHEFLGGRSHNGDGGRDHGVEACVV